MKMNAVHCRVGSRLLQRSYTMTASDDLAYRPNSLPQLRGITLLGGRRALHVVAHIAELPAVPVHQVVALLGDGSVRICNFGSPEPAQLLDDRLAGLASELGSHLTGISASVSRDADDEFNERRLQHRRPDRKEAQGLRRLADAIQLAHSTGIALPSTGADRPVANALFD